MLPCLESTCGLWCPTKDPKAQALLGLRLPFVCHSIKSQFLCFPDDVPRFPQQNTFLNPDIWIVVYPSQLSRPIPVLSAVHEASRHAVHLREACDAVQNISIAEEHRLLKDLEGESVILRQFSPYGTDVRCPTTIERNTTVEGNENGGCRDGKERVKLPPLIPHRNYVRSCAPPRGP